MHSSKDIQYMRGALNLARRGLGRTAPNPSVGCVIVKGGKVVGQGRTAEGGRPHAEAAALVQAGGEAKGATAYVTLEPCAVTGREGPCAEALVKAGIQRAVVACIDPNPLVLGKGIEILKKAGIEVAVGALEEEARALNKGFFLKMLEGRPFITLKAATTSDGKVAPLSGKRAQITGPLANRHVHLERSLHDAILVGAETVLKDNPMLTTRLEGFEHKITRIILDTHLRIPLDSKLVKTAAETPVWVFYKNDPEGEAGKLAKAGVKLFKTPTHRHARDLSAEALAKAEGGHPEDIKKLDSRLRWNDVDNVVQILAQEGITRLLVEGGGQVHASFIKKGLGDRLLWYRAPQAMGDGIPAFDGLQQAEILQALKLRHGFTRPLDQDLLEVYEKAA